MSVILNLVPLGTLLDNYNFVNNPQQEKVRKTDKKRQRKVIRAGRQALSTLKQSLIPKLIFGCNRPFASVDHVISFL